MNETYVLCKNRDIKKTILYRGDHQHNKPNCVYYSKVRHRQYFKSKNENNIKISRDGYIN